MKQEIKEKWVAALRSGEYQQTTGCLRSSEGFCCLGVLTDLYLKEHDEEWGGFIKGSEYVLPGWVRMWAEVSTNPHVLNTHYSDRLVLGLAELNDGSCFIKNRYNFNQIAEVIEQNNIL
ncbi:hypothetical protein b3_0087 [Synechococcus phage B3]|nr:hypothetical protein b3_0087 [Synechococcus phage B3]QGT54701.1 hypothetical protein b23_0086 [Synechococcus phage B23]